MYVVGRDTNCFDIVMGNPACTSRGAAMVIPAPASIPRRTSKPLLRNLIDRMHMSEVAICYGMTETSPMSTQTLPTDSLDRRVGTVGRVGPQLEIQIVDEAGAQVVERRVPGELCTRGYSVMAGYWNDPDHPRRRVDAHR